MGTLYVVATPLGNLEDLSARVVRCLSQADVIYAEDTRRSRILTSHVGVDTPLRSLHEHNERARSGEVVARLDSGDSVALLSDAGTPAISDPGADVVAAARAAGHTVSPIPGPSALAAALSVAGFAAASSDVLFLGFLAPKGRARRSALVRLGEHRGVVVIYEAPHRAAQTLADLADDQPDRQAVACRELTKVHEETRAGTLAELRAWAADGIKGELTLVVGPSTREPVAVDDRDIDAALQRCLDAGLSARDASTAVAAVKQLSRRAVYSRCQKLGGQLPADT